MKRLYLFNFYKGTVQKMLVCEAPTFDEIYAYIDLHERAVRRMGFTFSIEDVLED